jgi:hypothetical protein
MSHTDNVPVEFLQKIAGELRNSVEKHLPSSPVDEISALLQPPATTTDLETGLIQLHLCETFAVWKFKAGMIEAITAGKFRDDISECVESTKFFYHQVRENGKLVAFARSRIGDGERAASLSQYNLSTTLVSSVDRAIGIIELNEENDEVAANDPVVRLLEIPSHHIIALWLYAASLPENRSRSMIIRGPKSIFTENRDKLLTSVEFFNLLKQSGVIRAVTKVGKTEAGNEDSNPTL